MTDSVSPPRVPPSLPASAQAKRPHEGALEALGALQRRYPIAQAFAIAVLFIVGATTLGGFTRYTSIKTMLILASFLGISAVGQQIIILLGGVDLAVPSFIALGNFMIAQLVGRGGLAVHCRAGVCWWPSPAPWGRYRASSAVITTCSRSS